MDADAKAVLISAFTDGEVADPVDNALAVKLLAQDPVCQQRWENYHLIRTLLRSHPSWLQRAEAKRAQSFPPLVASIMSLGYSGAAARYTICSSVSLIETRRSNIATVALTNQGHLTKGMLRF